MDKKYEDSIHRTGRIGIIIGIILMLGIPAVISSVYDVWPKSAAQVITAGSGLLAVVALLALAGGGAFAYVKFIKPNRSGVKVSADPDEYDFPDEEYINEDEPAEAETEAEHE